MTTTPYDYNTLQRKIITVAMHAYKNFSDAAPYDTSYYHLNPYQCTQTITNAVSDIRRAADYHSDTGPSKWKIAGHVSAWFAYQHPIQLSKAFPVNQTNHQLLEINSRFATHLLQALLDVALYPKLQQDLRYCFEFRKIHGDAIELLLEHALDYSVEHHSE